ncbi:MAG: YqaE/Pmp3 family membrane protein [Candidatus Pseudobacter hemicellulosilyticus]|uniref:YqaE/Pmp3 family membrane protein n=1 Tax=Candidatus Pseudobacter hemicellulosilyticus TaxID=3121375 RepID=A0AAJ5WV07_9BACT|nr:MAG: YqaE/Pmp3 family membrane protein [Pseudobacter sp.]
MKKFNTRFFALLMLISTTTMTVPVLAIEPVVPAAAAPAAEPEPEAVKSAMREFKSLSRTERKARIKDAKKLMKEYKADKRAGKDAAETDQVLLAILAILLPPLAVYLKTDEVGSKFWLSVILTLLFWIPGVVYALLVVFDAV